jgi:hypothetical protein
MAVGIEPTANAFAEILRSAGLRRDAVATDISFSPTAGRQLKIHDAISEGEWPTLY